MMSYQYARLAAGRKKQYRDAFYVCPCTEAGEPIDCISEEDEYQYYCKHVIAYEIKDSVMYCHLEGVH